MKLAVQMTCSLAFGIVFFGLALFWPAGTFHYWQAWVFIAIFMGTSIVPSAYLAVKNPAALPGATGLGDSPSPMLRRAELGSIAEIPCTGRGLMPLL